jgi:hypothetical protein
MQKKCAYLIVRAVLDGDVEVSAFEEWYAKEHLDRATEMLGALQGWRFWSDDEAPPPVHYAVYEFPSRASLEQALASSSYPVLIREFDERWGISVKRVRSRIVLDQVVSRES